MYFIKNYSLQNIRNKLLLLYTLNVTDIIFTILLLSTGFYIEANSLMAKALQHPSLTLILKIVLPAALFIFIYHRMRKATNTQLKHSNVFIIGAIILYSLINFSHLVWFGLLIIFL